MKKKYDWFESELRAGEKMEYEKWVAPKLEWLKKKNPNYWFNIIHGYSRGPRKWSFEVWKKWVEDRENLRRDDPSTVF